MSPILKKLFLLAFLALGLGGLSLSFWKAHHRKPASMPLSIQKPPRLWAHSPSGKMNRAITVEIIPIGGVPDHDEQDLQLKAEVTLHQNIDGEIHFQWVLPPEAKVVSGELEDSWVGLKPGQTATAEITLNGVSREEPVKTVFFHVTGNSSGLKLGGFGAFGTNDPAFFSTPDQANENNRSLNEKTEASEKTISPKESFEKHNRPHY